MGLENAPAMPTCVRLYHRWHCIVDALLCHARKIWRILRPSRSSWMRLLPIVHLTSDQLAPYVVGALGICCVEHKDSSSFDFNRIDILTNQLIVKDAKKKKRQEKSKDISWCC